MLKRIINKSFFVFISIAQIAYGDTFGFVPDGGNYYEAFTENNDATIQIKVDETGGNGFSVTFRLYVDYTTNVSTTEWTNGGSGTGYYKDWNASGISWSSDNQTTTGGYVNSGINYSGNTVYWQVTLNSSTTDATDGIYTITLPIYDDNIYEGGSSGTPETICFYISNVIGATTLDSDKDEFVVKITDNDKIPYYHFGQSAAQAFDEGHDTNDDGNGVSFNIQPVANPTDNVVYYAGTNAYTINYSFTNGTTTSSDYTDHYGGSITINEQISGANTTGGSTSRYWTNRDIRVEMVDDNIDEPDTETFTIALSSSDANDGALGSNTSLNVTINDDPSDTPPYVYFVNEVTWVDETDADQNVTVDLALHAGSGFQDPSIPILVHASSTAIAGGTDHNLANQTVIFDGAVGDQAASFTFSLIGDNRDEGTDASTSVFETIVITLDNDNALYTQVDVDGSAGHNYTTHTIKIKDDDPAPYLRFNDGDVSVTAEEGNEGIQSNGDAAVPNPVLKVIAVSASGGTSAYPSNLDMTFTVREASSPGTATFKSTSLAATAPWDWKFDGDGDTWTGTISAGETSLDIPIIINDDAYWEGSTNETVKISATAGNNAQSGGPLDWTYTIIENETKPELRFKLYNSEVTSLEEDADVNRDVEVELSGLSTEAVNFTYSITSTNAGTGDNAYLTNSTDDDNDGSQDETGEGDASSDITLPSTTGTITALTNTNTTSQSTNIQFTHKGDFIDELNKYAQLTLAVASGYDDAAAVSNSTKKQLIVLTDDETPVTFGFAAATDASNNESDATETITISKIDDSANGNTGDTEFTMNATLSVGVEGTATDDGTSNDDFDLSVTGGAAISAGATHTFTIGPSATQAQFDVDLRDDDYYEGGSGGTKETINFKLGSFVNAAAGPNTELLYSITDITAAPTVQFSNDASKSKTDDDENDDPTPDITVIQNRKSAVATTIDFSAAAKTGTTTLTSEDYTLTGTTATIAADALETTLDLDILPDDFYEADESITISLDGSSVANAIAGSRLTHDYEITNDDQKPTVNFFASDASGSSATASTVSEADGSVQIPVNLSLRTGMAAEVTYTIASSTGASDADWSDGTEDFDGDNATNKITWAADDAIGTPKTIVVNFTDDTIDEGDEIITVTLSAVSGGATIGSDVVHTITLQDSDIPPVMQFTSNSMNVDESVSGGTFNVNLSLTHDGTNLQASDAGIAEMTWTINTSSSTATTHASEDDYPYDITSAASGQVQIAKGQTAGTITFQINEDIIDEWSEVLVLDLSSPNSFATASGNQTITININDGSDVAPTVNFTTTTLGSGTTENQSSTSTINFTDYIALTGKSGKDLWFSYKTEVDGSGATATAGQDYTALDGTFKIIAGQTVPASTVPLVILDDLIDEDDEQTVKITIAVLGADQDSDPANYEATSDAETAADGNMVFTYTIDDDEDPPNAYFKNVDGNTDDLTLESGSVTEAGTATIVVELSAASERDIVLYYSDAGTGDATSTSDYTAIANYTAITTIAGNAGTTEASFDVVTAPDEIDEGAGGNDYQTVVLRLYSTPSSTSDMETISNATAGGGAGIESVKLYTLKIIDDDDLPVVNFTDGNGWDIDGDTESSVAENGSSITLNIELSRATERTVTIPFTFTDYGTITNGAQGAGATGAYPIDWYYSSSTKAAGGTADWSTGATFDAAGSVTITGDGTTNPSGTKATFDISILSDAFDEWDETFVVSLGTITNGQKGTAEDHTVTITDVSEPPVIGFTSLTYDTGTETNQAASAYNLKDIIALSPKSGRNLQFSVTTEAVGTGATATAGQDYTTIDGTFIITAGNTAPSADIDLTILNESIDEDDEQTVKVTIAVIGSDEDGDGVYEQTDADKTATAGDMVFTYTINDDDPVPNAFFKNVDATEATETGSVTEAGTADIVVKLSAASERDIKLYYSDNGSGDATSVLDYTAITDYTPITIAGNAGTTEATIQVVTEPDDIDEGANDLSTDYQTVEIKLYTTPVVSASMETVSNALASSSNSGEQGVVLYTLKIDDDDDLPQVNFTNGSGTADSESSVAENGSSITINFELSRATERTVTIPFTFADYGGLTKGARGAAATGDYPVDWFYSSSKSASGGSAVWTTGASFDAGGSVTITGDGSTNASGTKATFDLNIESDDIDEWDEDIVINLGSPSNGIKGGTQQHTVTITDASTAPSIAFTNFSVDDGIAETTQANNDFNLKNIIALSSQSGKDITFTVKTNVADNGATATAAQDYTELDGTFTISAGQTAPSNNIILDILDDAYDEVDKQTVVVNIGFLGADIEGDGTYDDPVDDPAATNGNVTFTYNINDDEPSPVLVFSSSTYNVDESAGNTDVVKIIFDDTGTTLTERTVTGLLSVKSAGTTAISGSDFTSISDNTSLVVSDGIAGTTFPGLIITEDDRWEVAEDIVLEISVNADGSGNATIDGSNYTTTVTIGDDGDDEPAIEFISSATGLALSEDDINESDGSYKVYVGITNGKISEKEITIPYSINFSSSTAKFDVDGNGTETDFPADYVKWGSSTTSNFTTTALSYTSPNVSATGTITILAGDATTLAADQKTFFTVPINTDGTDENLEYLDFDLGTLTNAKKGTDATTFRLKIADHASDVPVKYSFATASAGTAPSVSGAENESPDFMVVLLDPDDQTQLKESGKEITISWTIDLDGTNGDASKDVTEALDFKLPDFGGGTTYTANLVFTPRTGSGTAAPTSLTIGTSEIDFDEADVTYESTEYFKLSLASADDNAAVGSSDGATNEHYYGITNIDSKPVIFLTDSDNGVSLYEQSGQGANTHDFQIEVLSTGIQKSELPIYAYFRVSATASDGDNDADISYTGTYEAGDLDYTYANGPLLTNQFVLIPAPITASSTGSIQLKAYDDALYEQNEKFVLGMYTYDAAQAAAASYDNNVGLESESYATASDGAKVDDTGYDEVEVTIFKDPLDMPLVNFVNADGTQISTVSFREDTSSAKYTVRVKATTTSSEAITIPYSITLDYDNDEKTARLGVQDDSYPYDYWITSESDPNFSITGDRSTNTVEADGWLVIPASTLTDTNIEATFDITINNDVIYEFDEKIILTLGDTDNATLNNANLGSNKTLTITIKNTGESKSEVAFSSTNATGNEPTVDSIINLPISLDKVSGKDITLKYSIDHTMNYPIESDIDYYDPIYENNENTATKGIDYSFGSSVIKSVEGDSIITIPAGSIAVNIPLTIKADDYYEYDQKLRVGISILSSLDDNDAGSMGDESVFTYTIIDDDSEPYIRFEADVIANETNANSINEAVTVSLVNSSGEFVQSEKPITATYALDIEKGDSEIEYTSGSLDSDDTYDKYSDDFSFSNGDLSFAVRTYSYSPAPADSFIVTNGDSSKDITLTIFGDDLYEVDEYVNIEISTVTNAQPKDASASDFSYVYTIQNDDAMPSVNWSDTNPTLITEGDPEGLGEEGDYINNAIKVALSKESGTDILVEYSLVTDEAQKGTATAGIDNNFDINLADDNPTFNTKTIIILAATDAESELTASIPITVWDDFIVESTDDAENETFKLQIDKYRDKGEDGDWDNTEDTDDSIKVEVQFSKMQEVTIIDNDTPPSEFDVGSVITKTTSTEPIVDSHWNPVKIGYWNSYNTGLEVTVPIENNSKLEGGSVKLIARIAGGTPVSNYTDEYDWADLTTESILITPDKISVDEKNIVFEVSAGEFEDTAADPLWYVEGSEVDISAIITDVYGNERIGNPSVTTITIDETVPSVDDYIITSASASGGNEYDNYWNSTNTGLDVIIKAQNDPIDASVSGGSVRVLAGIGADPLTADYYQLGDPVLINAVNNNVNDSIPIAIVKNSVINQIDYDQGRAINLKAEIVDISGNKRMLDIATQGVGGKIVIDTVHASVAVTYSRKFVNESHSPTITATYDDNDPPFSTPKISVEFFGTNDDSDIIETIMQVSTANKIYNYSLDVPGSYGDETYDGVATVTIDGTDMAGNPLDTTETNGRTVLRVDNTPPTIKFTYGTNNTIDDSSNAGKGGDEVTVTAVANERLENSTFSPDSIDASNVIAGPTLRVDPRSSSGISTSIETAKSYFSKSENGLIYTFKFDLPENAEFADYNDTLVLAINGTDWAGNEVGGYLDGIDSTNKQFKLDNQKPVLNSFNIDSGSFISSTQLGWTNSEVLSSGWVKFALSDGSGTPEEINLDGDELESGSREVGTLANNTSLVTAIGDSNKFNVTYHAVDFVGNVSDTTIQSVTYDKLPPRLRSVSYETEYITSLTNPATGTVVNVTFSELLDEDSQPVIKIYYGATQSQQINSAIFDGDPDLLIRTKTLTISDSDPLLWSAEIRSNEVPIPDSYDGYAWLMRVNSSDLAGNQFAGYDAASLAIGDSVLINIYETKPTGDPAVSTSLPVFTNFLFVDNTQPTANITYTNKRDSLLTTYNSENEDESYCCFAIHGDTVEVKVEMNELIRYNPDSSPRLNLYYNINGNIALGLEDIAGDTVLGFPHNEEPNLSIDSVGQVAQILYYDIVIPDDVKNHGTLQVELDAVDRSGTPITNYKDSDQKPGTESSYALEIDNIHPWGIPIYPIFADSSAILNQDGSYDVTFPIDTFKTTGYRVVEHWINSGTDYIYADVPYLNPEYDNSLMNNNPDWGPQGKIDLQLKNTFIGQWETIGSADIISPGSPQTSVVGNYFLRTISRPIEDFKDNPDMISQDPAASNTLQFRAVITDKNGNITEGQISDAYKINSGNLYVPDLSNTDEIGYDIIAPDLGAINDGNFDTEYIPGDTLRIISSDTITISWSEFIDPGDVAASGVDLYEMQVYTYPSWDVADDGTGADTLGMSDSLFTVDMNLDGIDDPGHWYKIYKEQAPSFNNPITLNTLDSAVYDSTSKTTIIYNYNDTLKHEIYYMIAVRAFDAAGNASDTIYTNAIQRYNSAPVFVDNLADLILYEDIAWDYDTVKVSDLDLYTLQSDSFKYTIIPKKIVPNLAGGFDENIVLINPPLVDESTGLVSWTPIQDSTLTLEGADTIIDQSGNYLFTFRVEDAYGFKDSINFNATVNAVNDTPVVAILGDDKVLTWQEDKPASEIVKINLSNYVKDIDNLDSELSWQFVIMDTSQLDEDFPLASVIVGPGTPKAVQTKLMRKYMGFDPSKGIDIPTLAKKSGNSTMQMLTNADSYISIDIDTSIVDSTIAIFSSDSNYHGSNHRIIFSAIDPFGALDKDTIIVNILPENDPPMVVAIDTIIINENDSIWIDFSQFTSDVDDTTLTFKIEGVYNTDSINYVSEPYLSDGIGDTVLFDPFDLWSGYANFRVTASDEEAESSQLFTLKVLRVPRPDIQVSLVQNNAFSSYVSIIIVDKEQKTKFLQLEVQNQRIDIDTVAAYTYTGDFSFGIGGGYSFDVLAVAEVGKTIYTNTFNLAPARVSNRWYANSSDGRFSVAGDPGSVDTDQSFLIVDSSLFISNFSDQASYVLGEETYAFSKPIEVHFGSIREDLSIYQRENGVIWKELPSINRNGQILTFTENAGYFRLGPKTIIVPEETDLHQNYPNPFNPYTTIKYDIGLMDGIDQRVSVNVYNLVGQHVTTLINNESQVGQFYVKWDGSDKFGKMLPSGIYFVQLKTDSGIIKNKKMMFLK